MITKGLRKSRRKEISNETITRCWRPLPSDRSSVVGLEFPLRCCTVLSLDFLWGKHFFPKRGKSQMRCSLKVWAGTDTHMNTQSIAVRFLFNAHTHTQIQRVRTPLLGGTRPLQYKPLHSSGLEISSINRAAGLLSSLLLELIPTQ